MFVVLVLAFLAMAARLVTLQIVEAPAYARLALEQRQRAVVLGARRGGIFDRNGEPLAISVDMQTIFADPALVPNAGAAAARLAPLLRHGRDALADKLRGDGPSDRFEYLARQVDPKIARRVARLRLPGVYTKAEPKRFYPNGRLASQLLGFVDVDGKGLGGVELQYEKLLAGRAGAMSLEQDPAGRPLPQARFTYRQPHPGRALFLTLDKNIQYFTEQALRAAVARYRAEAGTAIVMRPNTGEVLALANFPDFDPNEPADSAPSAHANRALTHVYEPGSVFKLVATAGALNEGVVTPTTSFLVPDALPLADRVFHDSHSHPPEQMSVSEIIRDSSNVGTIKIGMRLGGRKLHHYVRSFGFGAPTGLDFPGESGGIVLDPKDWSAVTIATVPIGQGIAVTPMQIASAFATVANSGVRVQPKMVSATMSYDGRVESSPRSSSRRVLSTRAARQMGRMLELVVEEGTGVAAQIPGFGVAGKTGTAQKPLPSGGYGGSYVASFAGFAPSRRPAVVALVVLDEPTPIWGGMTAAPTFRDIMLFSLRQLGVLPNSSAAHEEQALESDGVGERSARD